MTEKNCKNTCTRITSAQAVNFVSRTLNDIKIYIVELVGIERFCFELEVKSGLMVTVLIKSML